MASSKTYVFLESKNGIKIIKDNGSSVYLPQIDFVDQTIGYSTKSLLRYPGGKTRAVNIILKFIPNEVKTLCSPFLGGGSIELACTARGIKVYGYDIFSSLVQFWQHALEQPKKLANEVKKFYPLPKEKFYELQKNQSIFNKAIEKAAVFYVLNRSSYSGSTLSGGMSPGHPRFTLSSIQRLQNFQNPLINVKKMDFKESIFFHPETYLYLDPPYWIKSNLYGKNGDAHKNFDHLSLYNILRKRENWLLSYNNCPEILLLYKDYKVIFPVWKYGMSNDKNSREVLILSNNIKKYYNL